MKAVGGVYMNASLALMKQGPIKSGGLIFNLYASLCTTLFPQCTNYCLSKAPMIPTSHLFLPHLA